MNLPVTLILPVFNEVRTLPDLLNSLEKQSVIPNEIIFLSASIIV